MDNWDSAIELLARIGVALFAAYVVYFFLIRKPVDFTIQVRRGQIQCRGRIPLAQQPAIGHFLLQEMALTKSVKIRGFRHNNRLRLWFRGKLEEGEKQRIRNFLVGRL